MDLFSIRDRGDNHTLDSTFQERFRQFVTASQVLVTAVIEGARTPHELARCVRDALPECRSAAEFLLVRSVLVEIAVRTLRVTAPDRLADVLPLTTLQHPAGDLAASFDKCLSAIDKSPSARATAGSIQKMRAARALALITAHCCDASLSAASVAATVGVSPQYLAKLLRLHSGVGFRTALRRARIEIAREWLEHSFASVKEIAHRIGYASTSQFVRDFRHECGIPPGEYRRAHLGGARCGSLPVATNATSAAPVRAAQAADNGKRRARRR